MPHSNLEITANRTAIMPKIEPKNAPAIGPKNWNNVKYCASAPIKPEKFILCAINAKITNNATKIILFFVSIFLKSISITEKLLQLGYIYSFLKIAVFSKILRIIWI